METVAALGIGVTAFAVACGIGLFVNALAMWFVARFLLTIPDVSLFRCLKTVFAMVVVTIIMTAILVGVLMVLPLGFLIVGPWFIALMLALKATIEGMLEITEGGWTILILYIVVQWGINHIAGQIFQ